MAAEKIFNTYNSQVEILRSRGLQIQDDRQAIRILERENYYNLINGYKLPFLAQTEEVERYKPGADFFEIYALYLFDRRLRAIFLERILMIENHIKSVIAYEFSEQYGHKNYLMPDNFDGVATDAMKRKRVHDLLTAIQEDIRQRMIKKHAAIIHYYDSYGYIPLWVLVNIMSLGRISTFYSNMKLPERQHVAKRFKVSENELRSYLAVMVLFRNLCAHDERLYNYRTHITITTNYVHSALGIYRNPQGQYLRGKKDVFSLLISCKILMDRPAFDDLVCELDQEIIKLSERLQTVHMNEILRSMGFPHNWQEIQQL